MTKAYLMEIDMTRTYKLVVNEIAAYLDGQVKPGVDRIKLARALMDATEPQDGVLHLEIKGRLTITGHPLPCEFQAPDES